ncbi:MAG: ATP-binding protein [Candidatus Aenigmatarchaeota archaeon]
MKINIKELTEKWVLKEKTYERDVENEIIPYIDNKNVIFLYGPRRSGKSVVARRLLKRLPKNTKTRYVNLEDPNLVSFLSIELMDKLTNDLNQHDTVVFDEVQLVNGWEKWVRKAVDTRLCNVIVTGSSSKLLSSEFSTSLGGRGIGFQILPFSFTEFKRITKKNFDDYLISGGYPEVVLNPDKKDKLLESYFELSLIKDIITRYNIRDSAALRNLALYLLTNSGKEISLKKIREALGLSYDTIRQFIEYLEAAFLVFQVPFFSYSMKESLTRPRKIYSFDLGMQQYASRSFSDDTGRLAEAAVAIELRKRKYETFYWKGKKEVDFIAKKKTEIVPINVCYSKTFPEREFDGLMEFSTMKKLTIGKILYTGKHVKEARNGVSISIENIEEWMLQKE